MNRLRTAVVALAAVLTLGAVSALASPAGAAESVASKTSITPRGPLSKTERRPVDVHLEATVKPAPGQAKLRELINTKLNLPTDLTFSTKGTPVCRKDIGQINPENANRPTAAVVAECPQSVVGGGTAIINIAGLVTSPIKDSILTVFNGGEDKNGDPILLIHGYSATVVPGGHGIPMEGSLHNGVLDVKVPPLAANSAVSEFTFDLPGKVGKDPKYSLAKCSTGTWKANAVLTLGTYDPNSGGYVDKSDLATAPTTQSCKGSGGGGKATIAVPKVKGPGSVKSGASGSYKVTVKNTGKKAVKGVKVKASGKGAKGAGAGGTIKPGKSKTVKVKVKFTKKGTVKVKFKATAKGAGAKVKTFKVKVK